MKQRTWAITIAAILLAGSGLALATSVQGQDFERKGALEDTHAAYTVEWESEDAGKLRLSLDPVEGATTPKATLSIFEGTERVGTYTLDEAWPRLDHQVEPGDDYTLIVHRAAQAEVDVLAEEGHPIDLDRIQLATDHIDLVSGTDETIRTQVALDREEPFANLALTFEGAAQGLEVTMLGEGDATLLEATAETIDTAEGQRLVATLSPGNFAPGNLVVRISADQLDGQLGLDFQALDASPSNVVEAHASQDGAAEEDNTSKTTTKDTSTDTGEAEALKAITELDSGTPVAVDVPEGVEALHVVGEEDCGTAIVYGPDDQVVGTQMLETSEGAETWHGSQDDESNDTNRSSDHDRKVVATIPIETPGEHVVVLANSHQPGTLYMRVADPVDHRELDIKEVDGDLEGSNGTLLADGDGNATTTLAGGLLGFSWQSNGADVHREVSLTDPNGETIYHTEGVAIRSMRMVHAGNTSDPLMGPAGDYVVETESQSAIGDGMTYTLVTYER